MKAPISANTALFLEEAHDRLQEIEQSLVALEKNPSDLELINLTFRALHTIKGSGTMFGFESVSQFTHHVENLFDEVRKGRLAISNTIIDLGLRARDTISNLLAEKDCEEECSEIVGAITRIVEGSTQASKPVQSTDRGAPATRRDQAQVYHIIFIPTPHILHRGVKIRPLLRELQTMGQCHIHPLTDKLPPFDELDPTELFIGWDIVIATTCRLDELRGVFIFVEDYAQITIEEIGCAEGEAGGQAPLLGEILVRRGLLVPEEVAEIRQEQKQFGALAKEKAHISDGELEAALAEQKLVKQVQTERELRQNSGSIRIHKEKLDVLVDLVGELVILQSRLREELKEAAKPSLHAISETLTRLTADLRDMTMNVRMVPLGEMFQSFNRLVRDLSRDLSKEINLEISGDETELDKNIIEYLKDPLIHIIRNSADHGIESPDSREAAGKPRGGTICLSARQEGSRVLIELKDDGQGMNLARIKAKAVSLGLLKETEDNRDAIIAMIFEPGFSTAAKTTDVSGRGVGMDVVKRNIEHLRGSIRCSTEEGKGSAITLSIPLTLAIIDGLLVDIQGQTYIIPLALVEECLDMDISDHVPDDRGNIVNLRGATLPWLYLRKVLGIKGSPPPYSRLVVVNHEGANLGLMVDAVRGKQQIVIKPLAKSIRSIQSVSGATILGDGTVALILDIADIIRTHLNQAES